jgi:predicted RNA binding protein YcfA (HicA-like mRNA interferase family)
MNAKQLMDILKENGWTLVRIRGSHHIFTKDGHGTVPVPVHGNRDLGVFAKRLLTQAGIKEK